MSPKLWIAIGVIVLLLFAAVVVIKPFGRKPVKANVVAPGQYGGPTLADRNKAAEDEAARGTAPSQTAQDSQPAPTQLGGGSG